MSGKKRSKKSVYLVAAVSVIFALIMVAAGFGLTYLLRGKLETTKDPAQYGKWADLSKYTRLLVFPERIPDSASEVEYVYRYESGWTRPMCQIYLSCTLSEEEYRSEEERLAGLSWESGAGKLTVQRDSQSYPYPAYVAIAGYDFCYEYAMTDEAEHRIIYIYTMNTVDRDIKFFTDYLPDNFMEGFSDLSVSGLDLFTVYGGYEP